MLTIMGFTQDFLDISILDAGIHNFLLLEIFTSKPILSMIDILNPEVFRLNRNQLVRLLVLTYERLPNQSLTSLAISELPIHFNSGAYHMACREHKRTICMAIIEATTMHTTLTTTPVFQVTGFENPTVLSVPSSLHDQHPPPDLALSHHIGSHNSMSSNVSHQRDPLPVPNHITINNAMIQQDLAIQQSLLGLNNPGTYHGAVSPRVIPRANFSTKIHWNGQRETFAYSQAAFEDSSS